MAARTSALHPAIPNRRRRVRHRIQTPAYASFTAESQSAMLDLHEIINISEDGVAIQCNSPLEVDRRVNLCLDLAESDGQIYTTGKVIWSNASGLAGLHFAELSPVSLFRLREWLFLNAMAGASNADDAALAASSASLHLPSPPNYTDTLAAVTTVQRQVESLGPDLSAALQLIAERTQTLVRASGAAIALVGPDPGFMECRASSGPIAPPVGARLHVGEGFSGECVMSGQLLRCDDTELDTRVDRESCRVLNIRSILAAPVRVGEKSIGIIEALSEEPSTFTENDSRVLQRFADTVIAAVNRAARAENLPPLRPEPTERFTPTPGSVLFASTPEENKRRESDEKPGGIHMPRSLLILLICCAAIIFLALGYLLAPIIQAKFEQHGHAHLQTVLASSHAPRVETSSLETATFDQLKQMAENGDPAAENALGLRYFQGDDKDEIQSDEKEAFRWFSRAAEHGSLTAEAKLGSLYWAGRGVAKDLNQAYFWTVLARARGDEQSRDLAAILANGMTRAQAAAIEQQADAWLQQHMPNWKPSAGH
jgi:hypothetical protein